MAVRALVHVPERVKRGEVVEVRAMVAHPMETGFRVGSDGRALPRDLVRRIEARFEGQAVFAAELHAAIAANPYVSFFLRVPASGALSVRWTGDQGFAHEERVRVELE